VVFQLSRTFGNPASGANAQRGFAAPGAGAQVTGPTQPRQGQVPYTPERPTKGFRSWLFPSNSKGGQRGFPSPLAHRQTRPQGTMPNKPPVFGGVFQNYTPYYSRGAAAYVPNFGKVTANPIGAGIVALFRTRASYGEAAQYANGAIWWSNQVIPTSIDLQGLNSAEELATILSQLEVQGVVRTTG
jgi:hypothetical protein